MLNKISLSVKKICDSRMSLHEKLETVQGTTKSATILVISTQQNGRETEILILQVNKQDLFIHGIAYPPGENHNHRCILYHIISG